MALTPFATRGQALTALQEIATTLHVTKAALDFYFPAKPQLRRSLADPILDGTRTLLDAHTAVPLKAPARREFIGALTDLLLAHAPRGGRGCPAASPRGPRRAGPQPLARHAHLRRPGTAQCGVGERGASPRGASLGAAGSDREREFTLDPVGEAVE